MFYTTCKEERVSVTYNAGHRERLRKRFLASAKGGLPEYELLEILLFAAQHRADVKPLAKALLAKFGSLAAVITATQDELKQVNGVGISALAQLKVVQEAAERLLKAEWVDRPVLTSWQALLDYCRVSMGYSDTEQFRILYLNKKHYVIKDELQEVGTIDQTPVYPREIVKRALACHASSLVLVHNHPSGCVEPSMADIQVTRHIIAACKPLGIDVQDHVIVSKVAYLSMREKGVI